MKLIIAAHLFLISILSAMLFSSCGTGKFKDIRNKTDIELIAERDSVKVYRIINDGSVIYFTNKGCITMP